MGSALLRRHPSAFLLAAQLLSLMLYPAMDSSDTGRLLFGAVGVVVLALALWVVNRSPSVNWIAWLLAVPAVALTVGSVVFRQSEWVVLSALFESVLYFYVAGSLISYMLHDHEVSADELFAAGATFTLLFLSFTTLSGVGIGDILPLRPQARALVMLEEFAGVGYIAAIVSRLIGLTVLRAKR